MVSTTFSSSRPVIRREEGGSSTATANQQSSLPPLRCCSGRPVDQLSELAKRSKARRMVPPRGRLALLLLLALSAALAPGRAAATGVFEVRRKFPRHDGSGKHLANLRAHDARRHGRSLAAAVDLPLGGNALPYETGLYFTQIGIGTPAKSYYVQVDTSSDIFWVNCVFCDTCPRKSGLGVLPSLPFPLQLLCSADLIHRGRGGGHSAAPLVQLQPVLVQARQDRGAHGRQGRLGAAPVATAPPRLPNKVTQWFGLHIGVSFWEAVNLTNMHPSSTIWKEVLTVAQGDSMSVCLINFGTRTPFVSSLELRPLQDAMYPFVNSSMSISYFRRIRFGTATEYITRYPLDPYDRFWEGWSFSYSTYPWMTLNTSTQVRRLPGDNTFQVPEGILQGATTLDTNYSFFEINVAAGPNLDAKNLQLLPIFHFAEINISNQNRRFDIYSDNDLLFPDFSPSRFQADSMHQNGRLLHNPAGIFLLNKTRSSRLPPLINAFEVYSPVRMDNLTTDAEDAHYMNEVKKHYNLARINWNGDPCSPREYSWEGLTCDYSKRNQNPRIVAVDLSTSGLKGGLVIAFMNMVSLENCCHVDAMKAFVLVPNITY
ncbi:putative LRR receptor-like serine/threonine-protein kinase [Hordeum vulgare]|nr:putative LRR receptor-like serine/threonine-protein kinase [Hordeum vulgare]